jgi:hypothetical protein
MTLILRMYNVLLIQRLVTKHGSCYLVLKDEYVPMLNRIFTFKEHIMLSENKICVFPSGASESRRTK